jgi:hypothetical protein
MPLLDEVAGLLHPRGIQNASGCFKKQIQTQIKKK